MSTVAELLAAPKDDWDPTHSSDVAVNHYTTTNLGEAVPGVVCPLCTSVWDIPGHTTARRVAYYVGAISKRELDQQFPPEQRTLRFFYGRLAVKLEYISMLGDRMPGVSGRDMIHSMFNDPPESLAYHPTARRYPFIAARLLHTFLTIQPKLLEMCEQTDRWWREQVRTVPTLDLAGAQHALTDGFDRWQIAMDTHVTAMFGSFQPIFDMLERLVQRAGTGDLAVLSGTGGAEMAVVSDIWKASRGAITTEDVVRNHGFHGPGEGEISSRVWRDDDAPLRRVVEHYRSVPDKQNPSKAEAAKAALIPQMTRDVIAALPASARGGARLTLKLARKRIPDRGRGKRAFLQATDVARMAARRIGELKVADGAFTDVDDAFYLTKPELLAPLPRDVGELIARRRERRAAYERIGFRSTTWAGNPDAFEIAAEPTGATEDADMSDLGRVEGVGASQGIVEGVVRVVEDPGFADVEPGEVLVAPTTDPSWCSIMFVSAALVVDLGGMLSHAAVVARELGIPCVVNANDATKRLRTGDRVRVDGGTGVVEVLERAASVA
jgi:phosphohistidine swiveling domain-containing protein